MKRLKKKNTVEYAHGDSVYILGFPHVGFIVSDPFKLGQDDETYYKVRWMNGIEEYYFGSILQKWKIPHNVGLKEG